MTVSAKMMISVQASVADSTGAASQKSSVKGKDASVPFQDFMNQSIAMRQQFAQSNGANSPQVSDLSANTIRKDFTAESPKNGDFSGNASDSYDPSGKTAYDMPSKLPDDVQEKALSAIEDISEGIEENVAEELGISEEDLEEIMETLGLTFMDLLNPRVLEETIEAAEDILSDVDLSIDADSIVSELIPQNEAVVTEALSDNGISLEEFGAFFEQVETGEIELPEEIADLLPVIPDGEGEEQNSAFKLIENNYRDTTAQLNTGEGLAATFDVNTAEKPVTVIKIDDSELSYDDAFADDSFSISEEDMIADVDGIEDMDNDFDSDLVDAAEILSSVPDDADILSEDQGDGIADDMITRINNDIMKSADNASEGGMAGQQSRQGSGMGSMMQTAGERNVMTDVLGAAINQQTATFADALSETAASNPVSPYSAQQTADIMNQIVNQAAMTISDTVTRMEMELNPQHLGRMIMQVAQQEGVVTARLIAQNENVRAAIETQIAQLRENLEQRGIRVEAVEVSVGTHEFERNLEEGMNQQFFNQQEESGQGRQQSDRRNLNRSELDDMPGELSEEEELAAQIMRDNGGTLDYTV